jgi:flagellar protein FlbD
LILLVPGPGESDGSLGAHKVRVMIVVTRLNSKRLVLNAELIKTVEETPDTVITLVNGDRLLVRESVEEVVRRSVEYSRSVRAFTPVPVPAPK